MAGENTRERILGAAFEALAESHFSSISLSDVARRCSITKAAIYRHFASKEALLAAMKETFFDNLMTGLVSQLDPPDTEYLTKDAYIKIITFFSMHTGWLTFFIRSMIESPEFEKELGAALSSHVSDVEYSSSSWEKYKNPEIDLRRYAHMVYGVVTCVFFITEMQRQGSLEQFPLFPEKLYSFLISGWQPGYELSAERKRELEKLCVIKPEELQEESRIFKALASVVAEYGFPGATIERIANNLGMAKSSLYSYFNNKNEMMSKLILDEIQGVIRLFASRTHATNNLAEAIYVHMRLLTVYLLMRPTLISVFGWLRNRGYTWSPNMDMLMDNSPVASLPSDTALPDMDISLTFKMVSNWVSMIPVSIIIQCLLHGFKDEQVFDSVETAFDFIMKGIGEVK